MPIKKGDLQEKYRHNYGKSFEKSYLVSVIFALSLSAMRPWVRCVQKRTPSDDAFYWHALVSIRFALNPRLFAVFLKFRHQQRPLLELAQDVDVSFRKGATLERRKRRSWVGQEGLYHQITTGGPQEKAAATPRRKTFHPT